MIALFVHGMGRSPLSGWPMLHQLRRAGMETTTFGYSTALKDFAAIKSRLIRKITDIAARGEYIVIGHSLGGVLLRAALNELPAAVRPPRHVFLLGSPVKPSRLAKRLQKNILFRGLTGDSGRLLASEKRMGRIGAPQVATTGIAGVRGLKSRHSPFGEEPNDGIVALAETDAVWLADKIQVPVVHTLLPASSKVADIIINKVSQVVGSDQAGG
ncbi:MAG: alpha/beta fold hydrolase [Thioalkalispiraceae bacterium]|jgi:pimeloyl-ACP methyl ester carboxylesterase